MADRALGARARTLEGLCGHGTGQRVATVRGPVRARREREHDLMAGEDGRHGVRAARQRLAEDDHVGLDALMIAGEHLAGAAEARLHLVGDKEHIVLFAQRRGLLEIAIAGDDDAGLALDRLDHKGAHVRILELLLELLQVVEWHVHVAGHQRTKVLHADGIC